MPNHVKNRLVIHAPLALREKLVDDEGNYSLAKVLPPPPHILMRGGLSKVDEHYFPLNWYKWAPKNWGTKWDAYDHEPCRYVAGAHIFEFETAWNAPLPVSLAIVNLHHVAVEHSWVCEGACTWGTVHIAANGCVTLINADKGVVTHHPDSEMNEPAPRPQQVTWEEMLKELWPERWQAHQEDDEDEGAEV